MRDSSKLLHPEASSCALLNLTVALDKVGMWIRNLSKAVTISISGLLLLFAAYLAADALPVQDLAQYWSAAHLIKQNPYSYELVAQFESSQGIHVVQPLVLKNPPWVIPSFLPLGLLSYRAAFAAWTLLTLIVLIGCTQAVWRELQPGTAPIPLYLTLLFGPTIIQLMLGQWTVLVLFGIVAFFISIERRRDWVAGASLVLVLGKPHVSLLFLLSVALWTIVYRRWRVIASAALTLSAASLFVALVNPQIYWQFAARTSQVLHEAEAYPNLGGMLYVTSGVHVLGMLPQLVGLVWLGIYFRNHWSKWNWWTHGSLVVLCSVVCSYYSYPYDEILCLPALIVAFSRGNRRAFLFAFAVTNLGVFCYIAGLAGRFGYGYMFLWWTSLGWLAAFLLAQTCSLDLSSNRTCRSPERINSGSH